MQQIAALISGIVGAELGTAYFYQRGTTTPVNYYTDFEGTNLVATGTLALDAYGGGSAYVNQLTRVLVKNSVGTTIRDFVVGNNAKSEEVISAAFTGTDYTGAPTAVSKPTTAAAIFDAWLASAGATGTDWKVQYNGVGINLSSLAAKIGTPVFNVKAPEYGAVGDGVANDAPAINLAKTAAVAAGGGIVFFPPGTYKITSSLTLQDGVSIQGSGATGTAIVKSNNGVIFTLSTNTNRATVRDITIKRSSSSNSGTFDSASNQPKISFYNCVFGDPLFDVGEMFSENGGVPGPSDVYCEGCTFNNSLGAGARMVAWVNVNSRFSANKCTFYVYNANTVPYLAVPHGLITDCVFDMAGFTVGTITKALVTHTPTNGVPAGVKVLVVMGCVFTATGGGVCDGCIGTGSNTLPTSSVIAEFGNIFYGNTPFQTSASAPFDTGFMLLGSRIGRSVIVTDNSASLDITPYALAYETVIIVRTTNTDQVLTLTARTLRGMSVFVYVYNNSGGLIANQTAGGGAAVSVANGVKKVWHYRDETSQGLPGAIAMRGVLVNGVTL